MTTTTLSQPRVKPRKGNHSGPMALEALGKDATILDRKPEQQQHGSQGPPAWAASPPHNVSFAVALAGAGLTSYTILNYIIATASIGDAELHKVYTEQVHPNVYQWPMVAFTSAFVLNFVMLCFERESSKFQLALLGCYINLLAASNDFLSWQGVLPIVKDTWGHGVHLGRQVYLLSIISDLTAQQVYVTMLMDAGMILCAITGHLAEDKLTSVVLFAASFGCFGYVIQAMWAMFESAIRECRNNSARLSLSVMRAFTMFFWTTFPVIFLASMFGMLHFTVEEGLWTMTDLMGKVLFSTSLLQGNFLTIEQRRLIAMRIVEEGNRVQVIQELRELVDQKERFISGMSHELRTPLNGIIGLSEAMLVGSTGDINESALKSISTIKTSGARLLNLINDILDAASMRQFKGQLTIKHERVLLRRVVDDVLELCTPLAKRGVKLVNNVPTNMPAVLGDTGRLLQVFHNLLGNACKFTHQGNISVSATYKLDEVEVSVSDTGIGIPEDKFDDIFKPFEQVDMSTTRKYGGTGLGLNLVKQLVDAHGGTITVKSKISVGTTFYFTLKVWEGQEEGSNHNGSYNANPSHQGSGNLSIPASPLPRQYREIAGPLPPGRISQTNMHTISEGGMNAKGLNMSDQYSPQRHRLGTSVATTSTMMSASSKFARPQGRTTLDAQSIGGGSGGSMKMDMSAVFTPKSVGATVSVLSVDDDPVNQMVIQNLLAPAGYTITQAMDGQEALEILEGMEKLPDVILLDVMMPGMSGYEVCRKLRELYPNSCVPIIMISAKSKEEDIVEGLASGANDYVVKPFGRTEILARVATHLRFHEKSFQAGEQAAEQAGTKLRSDVPAQLSALLAAPSKGTSLPSPPPRGPKGFQRTFDSITLVVFHIANLESLADIIASDELTKGLVSLYQALDDLLETWGLYCVENPTQGYQMVVSGVQGGPHVQNALEFSQALLAAASAVPLPGGHKLQLAMSMHMGEAEATVTGVTHPVMNVSGQLVQTAVQLLSVARPGCLHVSQKVHGAAGQWGLHLAKAGNIGGRVTYLMKTGHWQECMPGIITACEGLSPDPSSVMDLHAPRMTPLQHALMLLSRSCPQAVLEIGQASAIEAQSAPCQQCEASTQSSNDQQAKRMEAEGQVKFLQQQLNEVDKARQLVARQLDEVTEEANRLADEVDQLHEQLEAAKAAAGSQQMNQELTQRVADLEEQLAATKAELRVAELEKQAVLKHVGRQAQELSIGKFRSQVSSARVSRQGDDNSLAPSLSRTFTDDGAGRSARSGSCLGTPTGTLANTQFSINAATDIAVFLADLGMEDLTSRFQEEAITPDIILGMDDIALGEVGVISVGARLKIKLAAQAIFNNQA